MIISIITTVNHNVGDDFVRDGIVFLLKEHFKGKDLKFEAIHKHSPITARHGFEWFRNQDYSLRADRLLPLWLTKDRILEADLVVQSGAPVYWCNDAVGWHCAVNEWYTPLIERRFSKNSKGKLLNLAAGACQPYNSDGSEFMQCRQDREYIERFYKTAAVTTVRDRLAKDILGNLGFQVPVIPCSSIFAADMNGLQNSGEEYVVVNYMKGGGHFDFGQKIDGEKWEREFTAFYNSIKGKEKVVFACHNRQELENAHGIDRDAKTFFSTDYLEYMKFYSRGKFGIMNRVHGAFLMASFGKPSLVIGSDTRAKMVEEIGLESVFVNDADSDLLTCKYSELRTGARSYPETFKAIKERALTEYLLALQGI
jgi:hypothetical protein